MTPPADQDPDGIDPVERARRAEPPVMPTAAEAAEELAGAGPPPLTLNLARSVWIAAAVMGLINAVVLVVFKDGVLKSLNERYPQTPGQFNGIGTVLWTMLVAAIGFGVFYVLLATKMRDGVRRARTILAVLALLSIGLYYVFSVLLTTWSLFAVLLTLVGMVLMFLPQSSRYFREVGSG